MCKTFRLLPDDERLEKLRSDHAIYAWMYTHWLQDSGDVRELAKEQAYCIGSFIDPERAAKASGEGVNQVQSSDEEFDESFEMVQKQALAEMEEKEKKRKRRKIR